MLRTVRMRWVWSAVAALVPLGGIAAVTVVTEDGAPACVRFGAREIAAAAEVAGFGGRVVEAPETPGADDLEITVTIDPDLAEPAESFRLARTGARTASVTAPDRTGAMYGCLEAAEQIEFGAGADPAARIRPRAERPFLRLRADNPFITVSEDGSISPWFYSEEYWTEYIRMLARNRYNCLDLHAMYQIVQTGFPNAYPYFLENDKYPESTVEGEDVDLNLRMFNRIIDIAEDHGINVALMNYSAQFAALHRPRMRDVVMERVDPAIDFDWAGESPDNRVANDYFSVRWTGSITAPEEGDYRIIAESDDGVRVWINGTPLIDDWSQHPPGRYEGECRLPADRPAPIRIDYFEAGGGAIVRLEWVTPGADEPVVIPPSAFSHATIDGETIPGLAGIYFSEDTTDELVDHTRHCVSEMIRRCPKLWMLGFRVGESGQPEDFYRKAYLPAFEQADRPIRLYTRTWLAEQEDLARIAAEFPGLFGVEIKYNGEHLGAPYHAIQDYGHSYSYQNYLDLPRDWEIIWQIRCNGTHRLFRWTDPDFMRRTVWSCRLGDAWGFTMEPVTAYYSQDPADYYDDPAQSPFRWAFQKHWPWYLCWGRLAYKPDTPEEVFRRRFRARFGDADGDRVYDLLIGSSAIIPAIYQAHAPSADHRGMAPEFENGNNNRDVIRFAETRPLDRHTHDSPMAYARRRLSGGASGQISPLETADLLETACERTLSEARTLLNTGNLEVADIATDAVCLAHLGRYYAAKTRGAVEAAFLVETDDLSRIDPARRHLTTARSAWADLAETGDGRYRPLLDKLRMHTTNFTWTAEGEKLDEQDLGWLDARETELLARDGIIGGHVPPVRIEPGATAEIAAGIHGIGDAGTVALEWRISQRSAAMIRMQPDDDAPVYRVRIPVPLDADGEMLRYRIHASSGDGERVFPEEEVYSVPVSTDGDGPSVASVRAMPEREAGRLVVEIQCDDPSGIAEVRLLHKILPTGDGRDWETATVSISPAGSDSGNAGTAQSPTIMVPMTPHGILYAVEVVDSVGNVTRWPDPRTESPPYAIIEPYDAPTETAAATR